MEVIHTDNLTRKFNGVTAVDGLSLSVQEGEIFGLVGPDGAGKTTTMRLLAAVLDPTSGSGQVCGFDLVKQAEPLKAHIGYMSQRFGLYSDLTVMENLLFYADLYSVLRPELPARIERLLHFSNMGPFQKRLAGKLSGGMKQKLGLMCSLVHTPRVLLLDEPTNGVDPVSRRDFWRILYQLRGEGVTIFVSTAYLDEAERCHRLAMLHQGKLLAMGTPAEVKSLLHGSILEVRSSDPRQAAGLLRREFGTLNVGLFGDRVHVVTQDPGAATEAVRKQIVAAGQEFLGVRQIEPSLEDVFISVLARTGPDQGLPFGAVRTPTDLAGVSPDEGENRGQAPFSNSEKGASPHFRPAVVVHELSKRFGKFVAVDRVSFEVSAGEIFGFLGPNGAGKSTTIRMLCGILEPTSGGGSVAGFDVRTQAERIKQYIGYMSQKVSLYEDLTVEANLDFYAGIYQIPRDRRAARKDWAVRMAGLSDHRRSRTGPLSGGWKQRLALGCAILHEPPVLFLDEPTSGVDPISRRQFWDLIYDLSGRGVTVFVTTHYMDEAEYCGRLGLIYRGQLIALGSPAELKEQHGQPTLEDVFVEVIQQHDREQGTEGGTS